LFFRDLRREVPGEAENAHRDKISGAHIGAAPRPRVGRISESCKPKGARASCPLVDEAGETPTLL